MIQIVNYLKDNGKRTAEELAIIFGFDSVEPCNQELRNMVLNGVLRRVYYRGRAAEYEHDGGFQCAGCHTKHPDAIRRGTTKFCRVCKAKPYTTKKPEKKKLAILPSTKIISVFTQTDVGPNSAAKMSQAYLSRRLI